MNWIKVPLDFISRIGARVLSRPTCDPVTLDLAAAIWCRENSRDGVIPGDRLADLAPWSKNGPRPEQVAEALVNGGVWAGDGAGYRRLDQWFQAIPPEISAARSSAGHKGGKRSGQTRASLRAARDRQSKQTKQLLEIEANEAMRGEEKRREEKREDRPSTDGMSPDGAAPPPEKGGPQARFVERFDAVYLAKYGVAHAPHSKADYVKVAKAIAAHGIDELDRRLVIAFEDPPQNLRGVNFDLFVFLSKLGVLVVRGSEQNGHLEPIDPARRFTPPRPESYP